MVIGRQPTGSERVLFINREPTSLDGTTERGPAHWEGSSEPQNRGNNILFDRLWSKQGPVHWLGVWRTPKWMKQSYLRPPTVETGSS